MKLDKVRRLAASILDVGLNKVWLDPSKEAQIKEAMTKEDVRSLIAEKAVKKIKPQSHSRGRARILHEKKRKGRKRGKGKRIGSMNARCNRKARWVKNVRAQRKKLRELKEKGEIKGKFSYAEIYERIKGGFFKGKKYVEALAKGEGK